MKDIDDKSIDMILADLPYNTTACKWDNMIPLEPLWEQYKRIIKDNGAIVLTASQPFTSKLVMSNPKMFKYEWIWDKKKPSNFQQMNYRPGKIHENICVFSKSNAVYVSNNDNMKYNPQMVKMEKLKKVSKTFYGSKNSTLRKNHSIKDQGTKSYNYRHPRSILDFSNANIKTKVHQTQKPVALFEYLIKTYTDEGDLVLDNVAGSGTTGVACQNLGRNFILIEKEPEYVEICEKRLAENSCTQDQKLEKANY
jgi:site-specific DNA-methyltransferase (adenine-specific)